MIRSSDFLWIDAIAVVLSLSLWPLCIVIECMCAYVHMCPIFLGLEPPDPIADPWQGWRHTIHNNQRVSSEYPDACDYLQNTVNNSWSAWKVEHLMIEPHGWYIWNRNQHCWHKVSQSRSFRRLSSSGWTGQMHRMMSKALWPSSRRWKQSYQRQTQISLSIRTLQRLFRTDNLLYCLVQPTTDTRLLLEICRRELEDLLCRLKKRDEGHRLGWERFKGAFLAKNIRESVENLIDSIRFWTDWFLSTQQFSGWLYNPATLPSNQSRQSLNGSLRRTAVELGRRSRGDRRRDRSAVDLGQASG